MEDTRFVGSNGQAIAKYRIRKGFSKPQLAEEAGVSLDTIKRAEKDENLQLGNARKIAVALGVEPHHIMKDVSPILPATNDHEYTWKDLCDGAKKVADQILSKNELLFDAVLTFAGPSSIFCGLVLARLPLKMFMRIPVYTALFLEMKTPVSQKRLQYFHVVNIDLFKILVPKELVDDKLKRIVVIDDTILTGGVMKKMRKFFARQHDPKNVKFACCICYDGRTLPGEQPPEIIGLANLEPRHRFRMPWGNNSFCFEDAFPINLADENEGKEGRSEAL